MEYVKRLDFSSDPDYNLLRKHFRDLFIENKFECGVTKLLYDWDEKIALLTNPPLSENLQSQTPLIKKSTFIKRKENK